MKTLFISLILLTSTNVFARSVNVSGEAKVCNNWAASELAYARAYERTISNFEEACKRTILSDQKPDMATMRDERKSCEDDSDGCTECEVIITIDCI